MNRYVGLVVASVLLILPATAHSDPARLDPNFGEGGISVVTGTSTNDGLSAAMAVSENRHGKLIVLGNDRETRTDPNGRNVASLRAAVARLDRQGNLDSTFADDGVSFTSRFTGWQGRKPLIGYGRDLATTGKGNLLIAGSMVQESSWNWTDNCAFLGGLFPNGSPAKKFAHRGYKHQCLHKPEKTRAINAGKRDTVGLEGRSVDVAGNGKILLAGRALRNWDDTGAFVARFTPKGKLDRSFRGGGGTGSGERGIVEVLRSPEIRGEFNQVKALRGRKILAVGQVQGKLLVAKLLPDGRLDRSFDGNGKFIWDLDGQKDCSCSTATGLKVDRKGRILVAGYFFTDNGSTDGIQPVVLRIKKNGKLDRSFGQGGLSRPRLEAGFRTSRIAVQRDGRIVVAGEYSQIGTLPNFIRGAAFRLTANGRLDESFFEAGVFSPTDPELGNWAYDVLVDRKGRIVLAGGDDWAEDGFRLARILPGD